MTSKNFEPVVRSVVRDVTRRDISSVASDDDLVSALGVDSLQGLEILAIVEKRCDVRLRDEELIQMRTIQRIAQAVEDARTSDTNERAKRSESRERSGAFGAPRVSA